MSCCRRASKMAAKLSMPGLSLRDSMRCRLLAGLLVSAASLSKPTVALSPNSAPFRGRPPCRRRRAAPAILRPAPSRRGSRGPQIDPQLAESTEALHVRRVAQAEADDSGCGLGRGLRVEPVEPGLVGYRPVRADTLLDPQRHARRDIRHLGAMVEAAAAPSGAPGRPRAVCYYHAAPTSRAAQGDLS